MPPPLDNVERALIALREKGMIILTDDSNRENEGDLVIAAEFATPEAINFMSRFGRGLICLALPRQRIEALNLPLMSLRNESRYRTAFTVSIEAREGISTGISAADRSKTILTAIDPASSQEDIVTPGHIFPLQARDNGVLERQGHTEGSVDLTRLAGLHPGAVLCEIMNEDGTMARMPDLETFSHQHSLPLVSVEDIIHYRLRHETMIDRVAEAKMPTAYGDFKVVAYRNKVDGVEHLALIKPPENTTPLVRVHSECLTGDAFGSLRCDCGSQLHHSLKKISEHGSGVLIYLRNHEGRGIGLANKISAYALQDTGMDTIEANHQLGYKADLRSYGIAAHILKDLNLLDIDLMTNNPQKEADMLLYGINVIATVPVIAKPTAFNRHYLKTKQDKLGHKLTLTN